jgi:tyrosyl-tRNA synthetase
LARELTELVHGSRAARAADEAADVLFGGDPLAASEEALAAVAREVPSSRVAADRLDDVVELLTSLGLGNSKSDVRRTLEGAGYRCNGAVLDANAQLTTHVRLHGRFLLLQRGKKSHHLVEVFS